MKFIQAAALAAFLLVPAAAFAAGAIAVDDVEGMEHHETGFGTSVNEDNGTRRREKRCGSAAVRATKTAASSCASTAAALMRCRAVILALAPGATGAPRSGVRWKVVATAAASRCPSASKHRPLIATIPKKIARHECRASLGRFSQIDQLR